MTLRDDRLNAARKGVVPRYLVIDSKEYAWRLGRLEAGSTRMDPGGLTWQGTLKRRQRIVWSCGHQHPDRGVAQRCSQRLVEAIRREA
jgi:hypothetical protein